MPIVKTTEELLRHFPPIDAVLAYQPLSDEPDITAFLFDLPKNISILNTPQTKTDDPFLFAESLLKKYDQKTLLLFIPGQKFDAHGTRHGRGGGWYDRFLSGVPKQWIRVGVLTSSQFSSTPLLKEPWDEAMDHLFLDEKNEWNLIDTKQKNC